MFDARFLFHICANQSMSRDNHHYELTYSNLVRLTAISYSKLRFAPEKLGCVIISCTLRSVKLNGKVSSERSNSPRRKIISLDKTL